MNNIKNKLNFIWRSLRAARLSLIDLQYSISPINYAVLETFYMNVLDFEKHYVSDMIDIHARNSVIQLYEICYGKLSLNKVINEIILNAESLNLTDKIQDMKASQKELKKIQNKYKTILQSNRNKVSAHNDEVNLEFSDFPKEAVFAVDDQIELLEALEKAFDYFYNLLYKQHYKIDINESSYEKILNFITKDTDSNTPKINEDY